MDVIELSVKICDSVFFVVQVYRRQWTEESICREC